MRVFIIMVLLLLAIGNMPIKVSKVPGKLKNLNWENINSSNKKSKKITTIIRDTPNDNQMLAVYSIYQKLSVYQNHSLIYVRDKKNAGSFGNKIPSGWSLIRFEKGKIKKGDRITLIYENPYGFFVTKSGRIYYGSENAVWWKIQKVQSWFRSIFLLLFLFGVIIMFFPVIIRKKELFSQYAHMGIFTIILGGFVFFSSGRIYSFIFRDSFICYTSQCFFLALPGAFFRMVKDHVEKKDKKICQWLCNLSDLNICILLLLHAMNLVTLPDSLICIHILILIGFLYLIPIAWRFFKRREHHYMFTMELLLATVALIGCISYWVDRIQWISRMAVLSGICFSVIIVIFGFHGMVLNEKKNRRIEEKLEETRIQLLVGQIRSHFIYNTLTTIQALIKIDPSKAEHMVYMFSKYLRNNIDQLTTYTKIPLENELEHILTYIEIEKVRFGDRIQFEYEIEDMDLYVPALSLQPLVENAIKHGICKKEEGGIVTLKQKIQGNTGTFVVQDNGIGFHKKDLKSVGIKNIIYRLRTMMNADLKIETALGNGTTVSIYFPVEENRKR